MPMHSPEKRDLLIELLRGKPVPAAMSPRDAAHYLGVGVNSIYEMIAAGELEAKKLNTRTLILTDSIHNRLAALPKAKLTTQRRPTRSSAA
jgi:excisionase family DNA binding protein